MRSHNTKKSKSKTKLCTPDLFSWSRDTELLQNSSLRTIARRAGVSPATALVLAELAGLSARRGMVDPMSSPRTSPDEVDIRVPRERLTAAMESGRAPHLVPLWGAVRDFGVGLLIVPQKGGPFEPPRKDVPAICIIGDDMKISLGPSGFHRRSLRRFIRSCGAGVVISCEAIARAYAVAATEASLRRHNVILIETRPQHEIAWVSLLRKINPHLGLLVATVENKGAQHARKL
jgi:hypothetical protein